MQVWELGQKESHEEWGGGHGLPGKPPLGALAAGKWHSHPSRARLASEVRAACQGAVPRQSGSWRQA